MAVFDMIDALRDSGLTSSYRSLFGFRLVRGGILVLGPDSDKSHFGSHPPYAQKLRLHRAILFISRSALQMDRVLRALY